VRDEISVSLHEDLARRAEVEFRGLIPKKLAVDPGPDEPAIGVDVDLGNAELRRR